MKNACDAMPRLRVTWTPGTSWLLSLPGDKSTRDIRGSVSLLSQHPRPSPQPCTCGRVSGTQTHAATRSHTQPRGLLHAGPPAPAEQSSTEALKMSGFTAMSRAIMEGPSGTKSRPRRSILLRGIFCFGYNVHDTAVKEDHG